MLKYFSKETLPERSVAAHDGYLDSWNPLRILKQCMQQMTGVGMGECRYAVAICSYSCPLATSIQDLFVILVPVSEGARSQGWSVWSCYTQHISGCKGWWMSYASYCMPLQTFSASVQALTWLFGGLTPCCTAKVHFQECTAPKP